MLQEPANKLLLLKPEAMPIAAVIPVTKSHFAAFESLDAIVWNRDTKDVRREIFERRPAFADSLDIDHPDWCELLLDFEPRLKESGATIKNITAKGYTSENNRLYPAGHSSGSYVFDLRNDCFRELFYVIK